jgi:toxin YhaV
MTTHSRVPGLAQSVGGQSIAGWTIFAHPLLLDQLERLVVRVERIRERAPGAVSGKKVTKLLAGVERLMFDIIPEDPSRDQYRLGSTLGPAYAHWRRAKLFQQYRLFFRYHSAERIILYAWLNDDQTLRAYESDADAYIVFRKMLGSGNPPDDWNALLKACASKGASDRLSRVVGRDG